METQVVITISEPEPQALEVHVDGPENPLILLGMIELAKGRIVAKMANSGSESFLVVASLDAVKQINNGD